MIPKFRAFYKSNKKMYDVLTLDIIDKKALIENVDNPQVPLRGYAKWGEIKLMQSTGLKDKNGVDIFEGDIFLHPAVPKNKYIVEWEEGGFSIFIDSTGFNNEKIEVIGNIYENPELLEVE